VAKKRNRAADFAVYMIIRVAASFLRALPFAAACSLAGGLAWVMMSISPRRVAVANDNLRQAFPGRYNDAELRRLVKGVYLHFCLVLVEIIHLDRILHLSNWRDHFVFDCPDEYRRFTEVIIGSRPVMLVTGHFGNWEVTSRVLGMLGCTGYVIARPLDNVYLDRWMRRWRQSTGQKVIAKNGEFHLIQQCLSSGGILGTIGDQDAGQRGVFVDFFNRPASTHKAIALLALEHKPLVVVGAAARVGSNLRYRCLVADIIDPLDYERNQDAIVAITARFTAALERMIRSYPEQYFWIHRRWKHQPLAAKKAAA
jgi:Kdo2-lipid IVA lauroyltransferase/acyltransferase